ncbi:Single-stranded DNA binding protein Ssb [Candidatus Bilamarchaeum dharawalense]|uniref:Single-stranded DNA binding protein Ssb n=1 Tax=Candidatus Bilamarchaeum dharawalense TaxID=2885759 RepID=A0A5E4LS27_9ARCH|nr:Single-stranded DNA binding protein Ssb [Candidatus Bilamarchaeum dharawalense]
MKSKKAGTALEKEGNMMKISELKPGTGSVTIEAEVVSMDSEREINKYGRKLRVGNATIKDDSGSVTLVLWNDQIDSVKAGDKIKIENGYVNEWQGASQLTLGKFGKLTVL